MGLKKDKEGLSMLSFADIKEIENGKTSAIEYNKIEKRFREFLFEIDNYKTTKNPNNHSLTQRLLYWKIGVEIIKKSPIIGVGSGAAKKAYKNYYKSNSTILSLNNQRNAHNQFITQFINLGLIGFLIWGLIILIPVIKLFNLKSPLMVAFFLSMLIALISDDMLERQAGVTICASIFYIFLFNEKDEKLKGLFLLKKNTK
jgi:O-antigen ligase